MKRWHNDAKMMRKRQLLNATEVLEVADCKDGSCALGRFRKTKIHACLRPNCHICHPGKKYQLKTLAIEVADESMAEQLNDLIEGND
jgi:hypothetical protein